MTFNIGKQSLLLAYGNGITRGGINIALPSPVLCRLKPQVGNLTVTDLAGNLLLPLKSGLTISLRIFGGEPNRMVRERTES